jgi:uncharacterized protein with GYD domain
MPTYITLIEFTQQGIEKIKDSPARLEKAKAAVKAAGGEMKAFYLTMGRYDAVAISEAPSNEAYAKTMLAIASGGAVHTETLCAFPEEEYRKIVTG